MNRAKKDAGETLLRPHLLSINVCRTQTDTDVMQGPLRIVPAGAHVYSFLFFLILIAACRQTKPTGGGIPIEIFSPYVSKLVQPLQRERVEMVLSWVLKTFPELVPKIAWNQPMFTHHGTFIIGFSAAKEHLAIAPEQAGIKQFTQQVEQAGYSHSKQLVRIRWNQPVDFSLLEQIICFNIKDKAQCQTFWRKS